MNPLPLRPEIRQGCPLPPFQLNIFLEDLASALSHKKKLKDLKTGKEDVTLFIHRWYNSICIEVSSNLAIGLDHSILLRCQFSPD